MIFLFPTGEVGKLGLSGNLSCPDSVRRIILSIQFFVGGLPIGLMHPESTFRINDSSWHESLLDLKRRIYEVSTDVEMVTYLLPLVLLDLGMGRDNFLLLLFSGGGVVVGLGRLHQTRRSPAVRRVEQSEDMETSVTQLECRERAGERDAPVTASQI